MSDTSFFVAQNKSAILIEGVAGSGKSTLLAKQMELLRDEPGKRLMLAFSRAGAGVLRDYTANLGLYLDQNNKISTIDALAMEALQELGDERTVLSSNEVVERVLPDLVEEVCEGLYDLDFYAPQLSDQDLWLLLEDFDYFRATMAFKADSLEEQLDICGDRLNFDIRLVARCFKRYEDLRWTWYSRSDASLTGYREREGFRRLSEAVSDLYHHEYFENSACLKGYRFVFIDEFHDISPLQLDFIQRLIKSNCFVMAVGDRYQNVFAWRGADTEVVFKQFIEHFQAGVVEQNFSHRFDQGIASLASKTSLKSIEAAEKPAVTIEHRPKNQFPELLTKPRKRVALIAQNQLQSMKSAWQIWMHTRGDYRMSYNLSQLYVVSLVNVLFALKTAQLPLLAGTTPDTPRASNSSAKKAFSYDVKRFFQGNYCFLSPEAKVEVIKSENAKSFQTYTFMHLSSNQGGPAFSEHMVTALRGVLKSNMEEPLAPLLAKFAEQAGLFRVIESAGLASEYHYTSWRILLKLLHSLNVTFESWPQISQSLYKSWNDRSGLQCLTVAQAKGKEFDFVVLYSADEESFLPRKVGEESARNEYYVGLTRVKRHLQFWESYF
ncbi:MAG: ATP-dependent helicase [Alcaligenaceae bacterium]|nr:ATP-dependent helicase [Alcaligenaceae bacterium]